MMVQFFTLKPSRSNVNGELGDLNQYHLTSPIRKTMSLGRGY
jgi:hypothetical protein